jgi:perosamine synthetase
MDAAGVMEALKGMGVGTRPFFRGMHAQEVYRNMGLFANENCPVSDKIYKTGFYLPSGQAVTDSQINKVIDACAAVFN